MNDLMTIAEAAVALRCSVTNIRATIRRHSVPTVVERIRGRRPRTLVRFSDLHKWVAPIEKDVQEFDIEE
jgi:hypothetical protein